MVRDPNPTDELFWIKEISISFFRNGLMELHLMSNLHTAQILQVEMIIKKIQTVSELMVDSGSRGPNAQNGNDSFTISLIRQRPLEVREVPENPTLSETHDATCMEL